MEKYNLIKSNNNVQLPSYLGVTELEILLKDTLRSSGDLSFLELKQFMKTYEARRLVLACNSAGICAATNEEPQVDYVSRVKFSEWVYQGIKRTLNKRNAVSHILSVSFLFLFFFYSMSIYIYFHFSSLCIYILQFKNHLFFLVFFFFFYSTSI